MNTGIGAARLLALTGHAIESHEGLTVGSDVRDACDSHLAGSEWVHVTVWYRRGSLSSSYVLTLGPVHVLYIYMYLDPLKFDHSIVFNSILACRTPYMPYYEKLDSRSLCRRPVASCHFTGDTKVTTSHLFRNGETV